MGFTSWRKHKDLRAESSLVLTLSSPKKNLQKVEFKPSAHYDHVLCTIEILNNDCYIFSSSNHQFEKCLFVIILIVLQQFHNFINVQYRFFLSQGGQPIFQNGGIGKKQRNDCIEKGCHIKHKGSLIQVVSVHGCISTILSKAKAT